MPTPSFETSAIIRPVLALAGLTGTVWLAMVIVRNVAVARGLVRLRYYRGDDIPPPPERIERPARAFMNLLEAPLLFYVVALLMVITGRFDGVQIALCWLFVAFRTLQAAIHILVNRVPWRFAAYVAGCVTLTALWVRFAIAG